MITSILTLDTNTLIKNGIRDCYSIHKLVYDLFPGNQRDFLYYDMGRNPLGRQILILSKNQPVINEIGELRSKFISNDFLLHDNYAFQIMLNPVFREKEGKKITPIIGRESLLDWVARKQINWGFSINFESLEIFDIGTESFTKGSDSILLNKATFRGTLSVNNIKLFSNCFEKGIGRAKAFGFGLLQLKPLID